MKRPIQPIPVSKRKRHREQQNQAKEEEKELIISEEGIRKTKAHIKHVLLLRVCAEVARRMGHSTIRESDFFCGCAPSFEDSLPYCVGKKPNCRFAGHVCPEGKKLENQGKTNKELLDEFLHSDYFKLLNKVIAKNKAMKNKNATPTSAG